MNTKTTITIEAARIADAIEAALSADYARVRRLGGEFAQLCIEHGDELTAKRLRGLSRRKGVPLQGSGAHHAIPVDGLSRLPLIEEEPWPGTPVILNTDVQGTISRFLHDVRSAQILFEGGLLTRFGLMLSGPPGTGKTLLAGHVAAQLGRPFLIARLDSLISSRLGDTAKNIRQIFESAPARGAVLFLDELDAIAKKRDDRHELGELKRVVNTVIQGLDSLDDQAVVIAATNHPQLLDPAIWRRFPYRCDLSLPTDETRTALWLQFLYGNDNGKAQNAALLSQISEGLSGADIENLSLATRRLALLNGVDLPEAQLLWALASSSPANIQFPDLHRLRPGQHRDLILKLALVPGVNKTHLASFLGLSRQMIYKYLEDQAHE